MSCHSGQVLVPPETHVHVLFAANSTHVETKNIVILYSNLSNINIKCKNKHIANLIIGFLSRKSYNNYVKIIIEKFQGKTKQRFYNKNFSYLGWVNI